MKYNTHKLLQITTIAIIVFAAYLSFKQVEGFQGQSTMRQIVATDGTPGQNLVATVGNAISYRCVPSPTTLCATIPQWITPERKTAYITLYELSTTKASINNGYTNDGLIIINNTYTMSKALNDDDGITYDKIINTSISYLNNFVPGRPNYYMLMSYVDANPKPSWLTPAMISSYNAAQASLTAKNISRDDANLRSSLEAIFTESMNAKETNDVTFNKIVAGTTSYISSLNNPTKKSTTETQTAKTDKIPYNLPLAIGVGVGAVIIIYFWIFYI